MLERHLTMDEISKYLETSPGLGLNKVGRSKAYYRRCDARAAPECRGVARGQLYTRMRFPPGTEPFYASRWVELSECADCARYHGRPIPGTW